MKANHVVVVFQGAAGEPYQIGKAPKPADNQGSIPVDIVEREHDRARAFDKARALAAGADVFFDQHGRPGFLQDFYNYRRCPHCATMIGEVEVMRFATFEEGREGLSLKSQRCPACRQVLSAVPE